MHSIIQFENNLLFLLVSDTIKTMKFRGLDLTWIFNTLDMSCWMKLSISYCTMSDAKFRLMKRKKLKSCWRNSFQICSIIPEWNCLIKKLNKVCWKYLKYDSTLKLNLSNILNRWQSKTSTRCCTKCDSEDQGSLQIVRKHEQHAECWRICSWPWYPEGRRIQENGL